jgi:hypothetical protein
MKAALDHGPGTMFPDLPAKPGDPIFNNPLLARFLVKVGQAMGENTLVKGGSGGTQGADLQKEATRIMAGEAYMDAGHVDHKDSVARVKEIYSKIYPEGKE